MSIDRINKAANLTDLEKGDKAGHPFYGNQHKDGGGGSAPVAPNMTGPKSQAAIKAIQAAAKKGDASAVANVNTLGTHPAVTSYRDKMAEHMGAKGQALTQALGGGKTSVSVTVPGTNFKGTVNRPASVGRDLKPATSVESRRAKLTGKS